LTILVADDNPRDFEFLEQLIKTWEEPCQVERAPNGMVALEMALKQELPLVISDIQMPEMNGIELARNLWQRKPQARIIFWSQFKDEMYVRTLSRIVPPETVYGYILKSNTRERIISAIRTVLLDEQCWIDPEVRKVQGRAGHSQTALSDIEFEALLDISLGLTDNLIAQRRYLSRRGVQSRLNSLYNKLGIDQEQFHCLVISKEGDFIRDDPFKHPQEKINDFEIQAIQKPITFCDCIWKDIQNINLDYSFNSEVPAVFQYSGGTTGTPKAAIGLHKNIVANTLQFLTWCDLQATEEIFVAAIPLYHVYGMVLAMVLGIRVAAKILLFPDARDQDYLLQCITRSEERRVGKECRSRWSPYH